MRIKYSNIAFSVILSVSLIGCGGGGSGGGESAGPSLPKMSFSTYISYKTEKITTDNQESTQDTLKKSAL